MAEKPRVDVGDKHFISGDWRSGKTTFSRWLSYQAPKAWVFDPISEWGEAIHDLDAAQQAYAERGRAVFAPPGSPYDWFDAFCQVALRCTNTLVVVDEPTEVMDPYTRLTGRNSDYPHFNRLWRMGHKRGVGVAMATHQITGDLPKLLRACQHIWSFDPPHEDDRDALAKYIGDTAATALKQLDDHELWHHGPQHKGPFGPVTPPPDRP